MVINNHSATGIGEKYNFDASFKDPFFMKWVCVWLCVDVNTDTDPCIDDGSNGGIDV